VIAFASVQSEITRRADIVIPSPAWLESEEEAPGHPDAPQASLAFSRAILPAPKGACRAVDFIADIAGEPAPTKEQILSSIHGLASGSIFNYRDGATTPISSLPVDQFVEKMSEGHAWVADRQERHEGVTGRVRMLAGIAPEKFLEAAPARRAVVSIGAAMPPLPMLAKLFQESDLYPAPAGLRRR
jgi:hypothetical protein